MGEVYRATDSVLQRKVAVKLLSERYARDEEVHARFRREALSAARLSGTPHVITVFDVGEHRKQPYIVMEYLAGGSVYDRLREGRVSPAQTLAWLAQAGQALDRAHAQGVVHRDVKPANLLLDRDGSVNVSDFGIASTTGLDTLTLPGTILGTAGYLSPEQARGEPATPASDRYALGVVAFELLTGRRPVRGRHARRPRRSRTSPRRCRAPRGSIPGFRTASTRCSCARSRRIPRTGPRAARRSSPISRMLSTGRPHRPGLRPPRCRRSLPRRRSRPGRCLTGAGRVHRSGPRFRRLVPVAVGLLVAGLLLAALLGSLRDSGRSAQPPATTNETTRPATTETTQPPADTTVASDPVELNDRGFAFMQEGQYGRARPLLDRAVAGLAGTGAITEAYASYNLAFTRFALGSCEGVLPLLDRSEAVQGERERDRRSSRGVGESLR